MLICTCALSLCCLGVIFTASMDTFVHQSLLPTFFCFVLWLLCLHLSMSFSVSESVTCTCTLYFFGGCLHFMIGFSWCYVSLSLNHLFFRSNVTSYEPSSTLLCRCSCKVCLTSVFEKLFRHVRHFFHNKCIFW